MTSVGEPLRNGAFDGDRLSTGTTKDLPIMPSSATSSGHSPCDPMDLSPHAASFHDPHASSGSPNSDRHQHTPDKDMIANGNGGGPVGAAAAAQQPKVVQTAFIHKLYRWVLLRYGCVLHTDVLQHARGSDYTASYLLVEH